MLFDNILSFLLHYSLLFNLEDKPIMGLVAEKSQEFEEVEIKPELEELRSIREKEVDSGRGFESDLT